MQRILERSATSPSSRDALRLVIRGTCFTFARSSSLFFSLSLSLFFSIPQAGHPGRSIVAKPEAARRTGGSLASRPVMYPGHVSRAATLQLHEHRRRVTRCTSCISHVVGVHMPLRQSESSPGFASRRALRAAGSLARLRLNDQETR